MRSAIEDKACYSLGPATPEVSSNAGNAAISFEFHKGNAGANRTPNHHRAGLGKPAPSKWDDAQKWLVGLSRGVGHGGGNSNSQLSKTSKPRNSNADDLRLIASASQRERGCDEEVEDEEGTNNQLEVETKKVDCEESSSVWRINKKLENNPMAAVRSVCVRDMGTEMTPIASQEPSRTATPIRATTPAARSPISSGSSTPVRGQNGTMQGQIPVEGRNEGNNNPNVSKIHESNIGKSSSEKILKMNPLDTRAAAWDEAERAKYMARYKREEVKIQAWENHQKRKAEMEMKKMEVKAERMKARAQEKFSNKLAATRRIAEEKRANAESKLNEKAVRTSERADYIRRTGHLPSSFSFKLPSLCW